VPRESQNLNKAIQTSRV